MRSPAWVHALATIGVAEWLIFGAIVGFTVVVCAVMNRLES